MPDPKRPKVDLLDEAILATALLLLTAGAWAQCGAVALMLPGLILLWIALPTRAAFVHRPPATPARRES